MGKIKINFDEQLPVKYNTRQKKFEYLARLTANSSHGSMNQILDDLIFNRPRRPWQKQLESMRKQHKKLGLSDNLFLHPTIRRRMGLKVKRGRHRRILFENK